MAVLWQKFVSLIFLIMFLFYFLRADRLFRATRICIHLRQRCAHAIPELRESGRAGEGHQEIAARKDRHRRRLQQSRLDFYFKYIFFCIFFILSK